MLLLDINICLLNIALHHCACTQTSILIYLAADGVKNNNTEGFLKGGWENWEKRVEHNCD